jgi:hypothetical protein
MVGGIALVFAGIVAFLVLHRSKDEKVYDAANGALKSRAVAELVAEHGEPERKETRPRRTKQPDGTFQDDPFDVWHYGDTEVTVVRGKIEGATNRDDRLRKAEGK